MYCTKVVWLALTIPRTLHTIPSSFTANIPNNSFILKFVFILRYCLTYPAGIASQSILTKQGLHKWSSRFVWLQLQCDCVCPTGTFSDGRIRIPVQVHHYWWLCSREVMPTVTVYRQTLPASARSHYRRRVWSAHDQHWRQTNQTTNLGHCWPGII